MLFFKRLRQQAAVFLAILGVVAVVSALGVSLFGYLAEAETAGARVDLAAQSGTNAALELSLALDSDPQGQDGEVRRMVADLFTRAGTPLFSEVDRTVAGSEPVLLKRIDPSGSNARASIVSLPDLPSRATLVDGAWPSSSTEVSLQADAAERVGIPVGAVLGLGDTALTVTGTWRVDDPSDPRWMGDTLLTEGSSDEIRAPVVVDESVLAASGIEAHARWTLTIDAATVEVADLRAISSGWERVRDAIFDYPALDGSSLDQRGRLVSSITVVLSRFESLRAVAPVALLIIGAITMVTLLEFARLLQGVRSRESELLWSRGATPRRLAITTALEAALAAVIGAAVGLGSVAAALSLSTGGTTSLTRAGWITWVVPVVVAVTAIAVFTVASLRATTEIARRDQSAGSGRSRRVGGGVGLALLTIAAAVSTWQLLMYGSPITPARGGGTQVDPLAVLAPALVLPALVLLAVLALSVASPLFERLARRGSGVASSLVTRTLTRRIALAATPLLLCALAAGQVVIAAGYAATWDRSYTQNREIRAGTPLRIDARSLPLSSDTVDTATTTDGVDVVAPVRATTVVVGSEATTLISLAPAGVAALAAGAPGVFDPAAAGAALGSVSPGIEVPADARSLAIEISVQEGDSAAEASIATSVILSDAYGVLRSIPAMPSDGMLVAELPDLKGEPARVLGFDLGPPAVGAEEAIVRLERVTAMGDTDVELELPESWVTVTLDGGFPIAAPASGARADVFAGTDGTRLLPQLGVAKDSVTAPIVISQSLADSSQLEVGDIITLQLDSASAPSPCSVVAIAGVIPGSGQDAAILVGAGVVQALQLRTDAELPSVDGLWVGSDETATAAALRSRLPAADLVLSLRFDPGRDILGSATTVLWVGAAGSIVLAIVAISAVAGAQLRSRRGELLVLQAVGLSSRHLAGLRRRELAVVLAFGAVLGCAAGLIVSLLTVPAIVRAAVPDPLLRLPVPVVFEVPGLLAGLGLLVVLLAVVVVGYGIGVLRQARSVTGREDLL